MSSVTISSTTNGVKGKPEVETKESYTYMAIYGSGFLSPDAGTSHDTGNSFKLLAEARNRINCNMYPDEMCILKYCPTDLELFDTISNAINIKRLDVYSHAWPQGLNLGGFRGKRVIGDVEYDSTKMDWTSEEVGNGRDLRSVNIVKNTSSSGNELLKINKKAFADNVEVYFWGCNAGGQLNANGEHILYNGDIPANLNTPKNSFAQAFSHRVGNGTVYALVGKGKDGGSMFKQDEGGNPYYDDAEMIPANIAANNKYKNTKKLKAIDYLKKFPI